MIKFMLNLPLISNFISHGVILVEITHKFFTGVYKIQKIHIPIRNLNFLRATLQHFQNIKPIRKLLCTISSCSDKCIYMIYNIYNFQEK